MDREQHSDLISLGLKATVGRGPLLHGPEPLDSSVRIAQDPEGEDADHDEEDDDPEEADEQLRADLAGMRPTARTSGLSARPRAA